MIKVSIGTIKVYQALILGMSSLMSLLLLIFIWFDPSKNMIIASFAVLILFILLNILYSKISDVFIDRENIHIKSLFINKIFDVNNQFYIEKVSFIPFLFKISFQKQKYYFILNKSFAIKYLFDSNFSLQKAINLLILEQK
jgi:hypothetical protein